MVPAFHKPDALMACLGSLARALRVGPPFGTVVVVNGPQPQVTARLARHLRGATVIETPENLGFGGAANLAARESRCGPVLLTNDDVVVEPGWVGALLDALEAEPSWGLVGSRVHWPDGRRQESGCVVFADGCTVQVGRGLAPGSRRFLARRRVDYASGCALACRREVWDALGGLDPGFFPGYYEDVDLCLRARETGWATGYEPTAVVYHEESASLPADAKHEALARGRARLCTRWAAALAGHGPGSDAEPAAVAAATERARGAAARVLLVLPGARDRLGTIEVAGRRLREAGVALWLLAPDLGLGDALWIGRAGVEVLDVLDVPSAGPGADLRDALASHLAEPGVSYDVLAGDPTAVPTRPRPRVPVLAPEALLGARDPVAALAALRPEAPEDA